MTPEEEIKQAKEYLARLLKHVYPDIEPLDTLLGLISQIDNGLAVPLKAAKQSVRADLLLPCSVCDPCVKNVT